MVCWINHVCTLEITFCFETRINNFNEKGKFVASFIMFLKEKNSIFSVSVEIIEMHFKFSWEEANHLLEGNSKNLKIDEALFIEWIQ